MTKSKIRKSKQSNAVKENKHNENYLNPKWYPFYKAVLDSKDAESRMDAKIELYNFLNKMIYSKKYFPLSNNNKVSLDDPNIQEAISNSMGKLVMGAKEDKFYSLENEKAAFKYLKTAIKNQYYDFTKRSWLVNIINKIKYGNLIIADEYLQEVEKNTEALNYHDYTEIVRRYLVAKGDKRQITEEQIKEALKKSEEDLSLDAPVGTEETDDSPTLYDFIPSEPKNSNIIHDVVDLIEKMDLKDAYYFTAECCKKLYGKEDKYYKAYQSVARKKYGYTSGDTGSRYTNEAKEKFFELLNKEKIMLSDIVCENNAYSFAHFLCVVKIIRANKSILAPKKNAKNKFVDVEDLEHALKSFIYEGEYNLYLFAIQVLDAVEEDKNLVGETILNVIADINLERIKGKEKISSREWLLFYSAKQLDWNNKFLNELVISTYKSQIKRTRPKRLNEKEAVIYVPVKFGQSIGKALLECPIAFFEFGEAIRDAYKKIHRYKTDYLNNKASNRCVEKVVAVRTTYKNILGIYCQNRGNIKNNFPHARDLGDEINTDQFCIKRPMVDYEYLEELKDNFGINIFDKFPQKSDAIGNVEVVGINNAAYLYSCVREVEQNIIQQMIIKVSNHNDYLEIDKIDYDELFKLNHEEEIDYYELTREGQITEESKKIENPFFHFDAKKEINECNISEQMTRKMKIQRKVKFDEFNMIQKKKYHYCDFAAFLNRIKETKTSGKYNIVYENEYSGELFIVPSNIILKDSKVKFELSEEERVIFEKMFCYEVHIMLNNKVELSDATMLNFVGIDEDLYNSLMNHN